MGLITLYIFVGPKESGQPGIQFTDPGVCKSFLKTCCPHELLASTVRYVEVLERLVTYYYE